MSNKIAQFLATFFYIGKMPLAPGSAASVAGVLIYVILCGQWISYVAVFVLITIVGFLVSGRVEKIMNQKDPSCVVIDEVSGVMIAFFLLPMTPAVILAAFFLFRAFDMFKIYPINKLEILPGSQGIMLDDILAGIYTNIIMHIAIRIAGIF